MKVAALKHRRMYNGILRFLVASIALVPYSGVVELSRAVIINITIFGAKDISALIISKGFRLKVVDNDGYKVNLLNCA
ncbi:hypothetical protein L6452_38376 [Arctium lappa]|uniref:Uncharacterized protein n=1 Tax=Arctium lappa TaxID=4217 RepID=A0ACB8Y6Q2_ARCLA|nr:hypothetical protein L6452_38376 [Arctium lappa]